MPFSLKVTELGIDRRGNPITSCTVHHEDEMMADEGKKSGRKVQYDPKDMLAYLPAQTVKEWQERASEDSGISRAKFYELKKKIDTYCWTQKHPETQAITRNESN